jgi:hypothetical protein
MNQTNTIMLGIFIALGVMLVAGLMVVPAIHEAHASNDISNSRNKGQQGFTKSKGNGGKGINT